MSLKHLHDFSLALVEPCMAITARGMPVDEAVLDETVEALRAELEPLQAELNALADKVLPTTHPKRPKFYEHWVCPCCRNGKAKKLECWSCAGYEKKPNAKQLAKDLAEACEEKSGIRTAVTYEFAVSAMLGPCEVCSGDGKRSTFLFNTKSTPNKKTILHDVLKLRKKMHKGKLVMDEDMLKDRVGDDQSGIVALMLRINKHRTLMSDYDKIRPASDGRIRTICNPGGTETFRLSHSGSFVESHSTNLGNVSKKQALRSPLYNVRKVFIPPPGFAFVEADLSQAEARVVACLTEDHNLLQMWADGVDVHRYTAAIGWNIPEAEVTKALRNCGGKPTRHAGNYGMKWAQHMANINADTDITGFSVTKQEAKLSLDRYHAVTPVEPWWHRVYNRVKRDGYLTNCFGRRRHFFGRRGSSGHPPGWLDAVHREAIADEPQSTVAMLTNRGLLRWWRRYDGKLGQLVLQIHDAVLLLVPLQKVAVAARALKQCMEEEIIVNKIPLTIPSDVAWSAASWADLETMEI